ncbi:MAG: M23 family metallopeptidase [Limosilactobacillus reuteri]
MHGKVSADQIDTTNQNNTQTTATVGTPNSANNNNNNNNNDDDVANTSDTTNNAGVAVSSNNTVARNAAATATVAPNNSTTTTANNTTTTTTPQVNYNVNDKGNYANLDSVKVNDNGQVQLNGWNATNGAQNKPYHYIIAYDNTTKSEITRTQVTNPVIRQDVQQAHNVYGAAQSGFNVTLDLGADTLANADSISFISRYSSDAAGNSNYTDFWYAPITFDKENHGWIDSVTVKDNQLQVSGWNATNQAANKPVHTIMVYDRTTKQVVASQVVENLDRPDVANAYPEVINADKSGFFASFDLSQLNLSHQLQIISRYSSNTRSASTNTDYYFTPITNGNNTNQGSLDSFDLSDGNQLKVSGWHADDISKLESNHFLILYDNTAAKQVAVIKATQANRPDVAAAYKSVDIAGQSGFTGTFNLSGLNLTPGHSYSLVSRYSTSADGNGGSGQYTDYGFNPVTLSQKAYNLDSISMTNNGLHISGWMASDYAQGRNNAYAIVLNNGKEVARQKLNLTTRNDVANAYRSIYNSAKSGFDTTINLNPSQINGNMQVVLRFAGSADGNSDYDDQYSKTYASNAGNFDAIQVSDSGIYVSGWHASDQSANKPYQYLIFVDANSGQELYRQRVLDVNRTRNDVASAYPTILNSGQSGFQLGFTIPSALDHHTVKVIDRLTDDVNGNGNYVDLTSDPISIHNNKWAWPFPADGEGHFTGAQLFGVNPGGQFRQNGFHDGLDFGSYDHPGTQVHAIHSGTIVSVGYTAGLDWYVLEDTGEYLVVYQEAFSSRNKITVTPGQKIEVGDVIGNRDTSHVHIGITREHNFNRALAKSFTNDGTWLNPLTIIRNGLNG